MKRLVLILKGLCLTAIFNHNIIQIVTIKLQYNSILNER